MKNNHKTNFIENMFDYIAPKYDLINRLLSLRQDIYWRKTMVSKIKTYRNKNILDVSCGTGDVAIEIANKKNDTKITGVDFSKKMLLLAQKKIYKKSHKNINLVAGNALSLPFMKESFDVITMAFGIRNIKNKIKVLKNLNFILKPDGILLILELSTPKKGFLSKIFMHYFKYILPIIGKILSKNPVAYKYLHQSVIDFPNNHTFVSIMNKAGFHKVSYQQLTMGIANLFIGHKY